MKVFRSLWVLLLTAAAFCCGGAETSELPVKAVLFPFREAEILSRVDGGILKSPFRIGERFRSGALIMSIDDRRYQFELVRAKAKRNDVRIQWEFAQKNYKSYEELYKEKIQSLNELERRKAEAEALKARLDIAEADVKEAEMLLSFCRIKAPFDGRVEEFKCHEFETVRAGQPLFRVIDDSRLLAVVNVPLELMKPVGSGLEFLFQEGKLKVSGKIYEISPRADHRSGTIEIKALIDNSKGILTAGMIGILKRPQVK